MIGGDITSENGLPVVNGKKLSLSTYNPSQDVKDLFAKCQSDYNRAWRLQHRPFDEFDGISLLERSRRDQRTFGAYVGAEYVPKQKAWRWRGRKNTARNKIIGLLAQMIAGMLYPIVYAQNEDDEEDKLTAQVMRIIVEEHLRKAGYQTKFMFMALSALVNPAVFVEVDYLVAYQRIKDKKSVVEAIDTILTGLNLNIIPIDQILLGDFFIGDIQKQSFIVRVDRITWDQARKIYGQHPDFKYVEAGKTRVVMTGNEHATLYDIEWTEADQNAVQVLTFYYRDEDLEVPFVGGVFMGNEKDIYNSNPFKHRRMSLIGDEWMTIPIYPFAKSGFEPLDPTGRFAYYKSAANKEYWDDASINKMYQLLQDSAVLDVIKPILGTGIQKVDDTVIAPGAYITTPNKDATLTPWSQSPNIAAAMQVLQENKQDVSDSTLSPIMQGQLPGKQTAFAVNAALTNAKIMLGLFSFMMADLIKQIGELTVDCTVMHTTQGELDATIPEALRLKYKTMLIKSKDGGKEMTNKIVFTDALMNKTMTEQEIRDKNWALYDQTNGQKDQRIYEVNPYRFARTIYTMWVDPDKITASAVGLNRDQKMEDIKMLTLPFVYPYVNPKALATEVIEEYGGQNPDRLKAEQDPMMQAVMGGQPGQPQQNPGGPIPSPIPMQLAAGVEAANQLPGNHPFK